MEEITYITMEETCERLGISARTAARYAERGKLTRYHRKVMPQRPWFDAEEVRALGAMVAAPAAHKEHR